MSDRDLILNFLEKAERRSRSNRRFNEIAATLAIAFVVPVLFKVLDFFFLFRGRTVVVFLALWLIATVAWAFTRLRGKNPLSQIAGTIDRKANLNDQLKTAYWFIQHPRQSDWVDVQIRRTAEAANRLRVDALYPRRFPRAIYIVCGLIFLLVALNFLPLSPYNWIRLQAAPPFRLTDDARHSLDNALKLLERAKAAENEALADKLETLINDLEQGEISIDDAIKQLEQLQQELEAGDIDSENITNGLSQMAAILRQSRTLRDAADALAVGKLENSASQMQRVGEQLDSLAAPDVQEMAEKLLQASEKPRSGLQGLAGAFNDASGALQRGDRAAARSGFDRIARELLGLSQELKDQQLRSEAGDEIGDLVDALEESEPKGGPAEAGQPREGQQGRGENNTSGKGEPGKEGEATEKGGETGEEAGENGQPGEGEPGDAQQLSPGEAPAPGEGPNGKGGNSFGGSTQSAPLEGEATALEVQLMKEALKIEGEPGVGAEPDEEKEAAGERERSKLDYRNAPSDLTPAQKDLLSQERIPWENRQLIKNYFEAVKKTQTK